MSPETRRERRARTEGLVAAVEEGFASGALDPATLGASSAGAFLRRFRALLKRLDHERYATARLRRSRGLRWAWFGEIWEEVIAGLTDLWKLIRQFARDELREMNRLIGSHGASGLLDGRGQPIPRRGAGGPGLFQGRVETAVDVRLVPKGGSPTDVGKKYVDRMQVSFQGEGADRWAADLARAEIKVPKKAWKLKEQSAEATPRLVDAAYLQMTIVDDAGRVLRREVIPVERLVINPTSTNRFGLSANAAGREDWRLVVGRARGFKEVHFRIDVAVSAKGATRLTKLMFSRRALVRGRSR